MRNSICTLVAGLLFSACAAADAALITFDSKADFTGETTVGFDGDGDGIADAVFTSLDADVSGYHGFDPVFDPLGPEKRLLNIHLPGLLGSTEPTPDVLVQFPFGARHSIRFSYVLDSHDVGLETFAAIRLFDADHNRIAVAWSQPAFTYSSTFPGCNSSEPYGLPRCRSAAPEGVLEVLFTGEAQEALIDFGSHLGVYMIDNFAGDFGSAAPVPEPASAALLLAGAGLLGVLARARRR